MSNVTIKITPTGTIYQTFVYIDPSSQNPNPLTLNGNTAVAKNVSSGSHTIAIALFGEPGANVAATISANGNQLISVSAGNCTIPTGSNTEDYSAVVVVP